MLRPAKPRVTEITLRVFLQKLMEGGHTKNELAEETGLAEASVRRLLREFMKGQHAAPPTNLVRMSAYETDKAGRYTIGVYEWAPGKRDAPRPKPLTKEERCRRYRANRKVRKMVHATAGVHLPSAATRDTLAA